MQQGLVKWFNAEKGYGFIASNGKDYFAHYKEIQSEGFKNLKEGDKVSFEGSASPKGPTAKFIRVEL